jgi:hypothetical protein
MVQEYRCPFCSNVVKNVLSDIFVKLHCLCGSFCQTDFLSERSLFPGDAAKELGINRMSDDPLDVFDYKARMDMRQGDIVGCLEGKDVVVNWARAKPGNYLQKEECRQA